VTDKSTNTCPTILILDDDKDTLEEVEEALSDEGFIILSANNMETLQLLKKQHVIDLFLIDINLPDGSGLTLTKEIRGESEVGIIIVSGKTSEIDRVVGLEMGADDYISKPFSSRELLARVHTVLRRTHGSKFPRSIIDIKVDIIEFRDWKLDLDSHQLIAKDGKGTELTTAEFDLLNTFVKSPNRVLSRDFLLNQLHGLDWCGYDRGVDGLISRLRKKLKHCTGTETVPLIKTVYGAGYMLTVSVKQTN
jgi:two-component system OmpR family response regulator